MTCLIRQADTEDLRVLPDIERAAASIFTSIPELAFVAEGKISSLRELVALSRNGVVLVAQALEGPAYGEVVGFLCGRQTGPTFHIHEMSVLPTRHGQGIGSALLAAILDDSLASRCSNVTLTTFRDVPWNQGFYSKAGFRTLEAPELDPRLQAILAAEAVSGFPLERRCAMSRDLK